MENIPNEQNPKNNKKKGIVLLISSLVVLGLIAAVIVLLVGRKPNGKQPEQSSGNTTGESTISYDEAVKEAESYIEAYMKSCVLVVSVGNHSVELNGFDANAPIDYEGVRTYISSLGGNEKVISIYRTVQSVSGKSEPVLDEAYVDARLQELSKKLDEGSDGTFEINGDRVTVTRGVPHLSLDVTYAKGVLVQALDACRYDPITLVAYPTEAQEPDWDSLYSSYCVKPQDARYAVDDVGNTYIVESKAGRDIDLESIQKDYRNGDWEQKTFQGYSVEPETTTENIGDDLFKDVLGEMTTSYYTSEYSRTNNLELATKAIDGAIILPGYKFSFNNTVGERTEERGYMDALVYVSDGVEPGLGGGICQVTSTLYVASLKAGLKQTQRYCHMYTVSYVEMGLDATVSWGNLDYVFENTTESPIKIVANAENGKLNIQIVGTSLCDDRQVKFRKVITETYTYDTKTNIDETLKPGVRIVESNGRNGYKVETYRTVIENGVAQPEEWISTSIYNPLDTIITEGPQPST